MANNNEFEKIKNQLVEQKITKQQTVTAGSTEQITINIPNEKKVYLKGYGYSWYTSNEFTLDTGNRQMPMRTDQEGSPSIPMIFGNPFPCRSGGQIKLTIKNGDSTDHTYDIVFYLLTNDHLDELSTGGELVLATGSGSGSGSTVAIYDSTFTNVAPVSATRGLSVNPTSPATLVCGTLTTSGAAAEVLGASTSISKITIQADVGNVSYVLIGNSTTQTIRLDPGASIDLNVDDIDTIYVKRNGGTNLTVNYIGA